jgi:hypothetical protein
MSAPPIIASKASCSSIGLISSFSAFRSVLPDADFLNLKAFAAKGCFGVLGEVVLFFV